MNLAKPTAVLLVAILTAACSDRDPRWTGTMYDSAGVTIVSNPTEGVWTEADRWRVEEELRIGVVEGDPDYQFGNPIGITVDSHGRIFVLDYQALHIQVYSPDGVYLQTVGGPGEGPGELKGSVGLLGMGPGDTLVVPDRRTWRWNLYAPDGSAAGSFPMPSEDVVHMAFETTRSGLMAEQIRAGLFTVDQPTDAIRFVRIDGTVGDTLATFPSGQMAFRQDGKFHQMLYAPEPRWDLSDDLRLLLGVSDEYRLEIFSPDLRLERVVIKAHEPRLVGEQDVNTVRSHYEARYGDERPPSQIAGMLSLLHFPEIFPAFERLCWGPVGTIWVQHIQPPSEMSADEIASLRFPEEWTASDWDVFDAEGRFLGVVGTPRKFIPKLFSGDKIYGILRGEWNVPYVVRLGVIGATES